MQNCEIQHACIGHCPLAAANIKNHKPRPRDFFAPASVDVSSESGCWSAPVLSARSPRHILGAWDAQSRRRVAISTLS